jgi:hypothetical protein
MTADQDHAWPAGSRKQRYKRGTMVRLVRFAVDGPLDDNEHVPAGTRGVVTFVDDLGTVHVRWDNGSTLGLTIHDRFEIEP